MKGLKRLPRTLLGYASISEKFALFQPQRYSQRPFS